MMLCAAALVLVVGAKCPREQAISDGAPAPASLRLIFADMTNSLTDEEHASVSEAVAHLVDSSPQGSRVIVLPISRNVQQAKAILDFQKLGGEGMSDIQQTRQLAAAAEKALGERMKEVWEKVNAPGQPSNRTCVFDALRRAAAEVRSLDDGQVAEVYLVTDMVEECDESFDSRPLLLNVAKITADDMDRAAKPAIPLPDLRRATVSVVIPQFDADEQRTVRPTPTQLEAFWSPIITRCNVAAFKFNVSLPKRLAAH